jgi:hypothetical protein
MNIFFTLVSVCQVVFCFSFVNQAPLHRERISYRISELFSLHRREVIISTAISSIASNLIVVAPQADAPKVLKNPSIPSPKYNPSQSWPLGKVAFSLLPLAGGNRRATVVEEVVPNTIWTFDQLQGIVNVNVPVRQTVIHLSEVAGGGLWVHNPVAPTKEVLKAMKQLERMHGPVRHIVLGTVALEHKATFGPFCQKFPNSTVWIQPGQWSFPFGLPIEFLGVTQRGPHLRELPIPGQPVSSKVYEYYQNQNPIPEWSEDISWEVLGPFRFQSVGGFSETAFFHKSTKTLIVTDTVVSVTEKPPAILMEDPRALLYHARDDISEVVEDTVETRQKGWRRMVQFGLVFFPSQIDVVPAAEAIKESFQIDPRMKNLGEGAVPGGSLYPWTWHANDRDLENFRAISKQGAPFCPPILTKLILDREPQATLEWVDRVCQRFPFVRIIPGHLNNNLSAGPKEFSSAFDMLRSKPNNPYPQRPLPEDLALLQKASDLLTHLGVVGPSKVCDGEPARQIGRFAKI